ncbi:antitoxin (DNA-binding transcriptional repressor) of toxin-antitoxin stability system [Prauserella sediminis]|uniref:Antitoxin (DNA-binding transcriptional repressor) of toxin-antitoxin stability system n=1 Tax=Prauserella sediminis TaxID=577680 RepID=A0A839XT53_9PSEU|nr:type II toxin-antitoxin system Phd/YefM family antitoxin [Prauserella sediminis]MBB3665917.1 antitoxin (DNA-binding transcriptional repressor) of toxin-antitoxin stability system [Prauserella sediminis]
MRTTATEMTLSEFVTNRSDVKRDVIRGGSFVLTDRGDAVMAIVPPEQLEALSESGLLRERDELRQRNEELTEQLDSVQQKLEHYEALIREVGRVAKQLDQEQQTEREIEAEPRPADDPSA